MRSRQIIFQGSMVRAILKGRKTQTRRILKLPDSITEGPRYWAPPSGKTEDGWAPPGANYWTESGNHIDPCPYGEKEDELWVRESWRPHERDDGLDGIQYRADEAFIPIENTKAAADRWLDLLRPDETGPEGKQTVWRPSIHMPRWACRLRLEITHIRIERLHHITVDDVFAEGVQIPVDSITKRPFLRLTGKHPPIEYLDTNYTNADLIRAHFASLWDSINAKGDKGWATNPWVWVIEFQNKSETAAT